ncbi:unnamed protein product [Rotaria magnacalcarata]|uniref:G-protein coupled receptors family 1 profile domain-containing protein n=1 Tax=Rotaria magnacalcarata TaxID=392030 RepID=A0A816E5X5_9BILA|nr:unnamed protein product [Rotaria magnacalcarata]
MIDLSSSNVTIDDLIIDNADLYESIRRSFARDPFEHYVNGICGLFICFLGIISNALSFSILIRRTMRLSTYVYLAGLCLSDFTTCLFLIPAYILDAYPIEILDCELPRTYAYTQILIITSKNAISTTTRVLSVWLCVAFTIDRWIMICRPFDSPIYCTMKIARHITFFIYVVGVFYAVPLMFEYESHEEIVLTELFSTDHSKKFYRYKLSVFGKNFIFRWIYVLINALGVYLIPLTTIIILNRKLLLSIRLLERRSAEYNAPLPTKQGVTIMLLATTIMLLVFRSPSAIISVMWLVSAKMFINEKAPFRLRKFHSIANLCATLNAATTFIMFIIYGTKFRSEFTHVYCCGSNKIERKQNSNETQQEQQIKNLISHNSIDNELDINNQMNVSLSKSSNRKLFPGINQSRDSTANPSLPFLKILKIQRRKQQYSCEQECDLMYQTNKQ